MKSVWISKFKPSKIKKQFMKIYQITILLLLALTFAACSSTETTNTATVNQPANNAKPTNESQPSTETAGTAGSPTEVLKSFAEATKKKDAATIKKLLSAGTMKMVEDSAKKQNISVDEMLTKVEDADKNKTPEIKNEKIEGDTATVEVKNDVTGEFDVMPFVKEDGSWKIALDVFMNKMLEKIKAESEKTTEKSPASKEDTKTKTAP